MNHDQSQESVPPTPEYLEARARLHVRLQATGLRGLPEHHRRAVARARAEHPERLRELAQRDRLHRMQRKSEALAA